MSIWKKVKKPFPEPENMHNSPENSDKKLPNPWNSDPVLIILRLNLVRKEDVDFMGCGEF